LEKKTVTHPDRHPAYFAIREPMRYMMVRGLSLPVLYNAVYQHAELQIACCLATVGPVDIFDDACVLVRLCLSVFIVHSSAVFLIFTDFLALLTG